MHLLVFGVQSFVTSSACLAEVWGWDDRTVAQKQDLTMLYAPYVMLGKFTSILLLLFVFFFVVVSRLWFYVFFIIFLCFFFYVSRFQPGDQWRLILVQGRLWRWTCSLGCGGSC